MIINYVCPFQKSVGQLLSFRETWNNFHVMIKSGCLLDCVYREARTDHTSPLNNTCSRGNEQVEGGNKEGGVWEKHNCKGLVT